MFILRQMYIFSGQSNCYIFILVSLLNPTALRKAKIAILAFLIAVGLIGPNSGLNS